MKTALTKGHEGVPLGSLLIVPLLAGLLVASLVLTLTWHDAPNLFLPLPPGTLFEHARRWFAGLLVLLSGGSVGAGTWHAYTQWLTALNPALIRWALGLRLLVAAVAGGAAAFAALRWLSQTERADRLVRGRVLRKGRAGMKQLAMEAAAEWQGQTPGISLHPEVKISRQRETKHLLVMGSSGSGKTHVIWHVLKEAIRRKDRIIIFDSKGDFTSQLTSFCLLAPWDPRSHAWDIAEDCAGPLDAREFAARLIPDNPKDPIWPNASRAILVTLLIHLQKTKPLTWDCADLRQLLHLPIADLRLLAIEHNHEALRSLAESSKLTDSILVNLNAFMEPVVDLAEAWGHQEGRRRFSMKRWIEGDSGLPPIVAIQSAQRFESTAARFFNSLLSVVAGTIASPSLPDDPERRIWLFLDEIAQLGELRDLGPLIRMGRSKGLRIVIGAQDVAELKAIYGTHKTDAWTSSLTTSIFTRIEGGATAEWVSRRIGEQESEATSVSETHSAAGKSITYQTALRKSLTVLPSQLKSQIGARLDSVHALIDGFNNAIYLVKYPYHKPKLIRAGSIIAPWAEPHRKQSREPTAQAARSIDDSPPQSAANDVQFEPTARAAPSAASTRRWAKRTPEAATPPAAPRPSK